MKSLFLFLCLLIGANNSFAQSKMKITIEDNSNGNFNVTEQEFDISGLSEEEIEKIQKEYIAKTPSKDKKVKVIIEDEEKGLEDIEEGMAMNRNFPNARRLNRDMNRMSERILRYGANIPDQLRNFPGEMMFWDDDKMMTVEDSAPIRSLDIFPNNPQRNILNVKFYAPFEGDISITVLDALGNKVETTEIKNFKGQYTDQIKLPKDIKGTYFVIVSQNGDGLSRRIVL